MTFYLYTVVTFLLFQLTILHVTDVHGQ